MKQAFILYSLILFSVTAPGQITLDKKYNYSTTVVNLETQGYKYYLMDIPNEQCRIYNRDHSLYKSIPCEVPGGYYLADIKYVSEKLFDNDPEIEILYTYYKYIPTSDSYYYSYESRIVDEDGREILTIDGARYNYVHKTGEDSFQLFSYCYDYSVFPEIIWTNIYNLPGKEYVSWAMAEDSQDLLFSSYPNPATKSIKVEYKLPENVNTGFLYLYNSVGQPVSNFLIDRHSPFLELDVSSFPAGIYYYYVEYGGQRTASKKIVVQ
jgi:hypothetical protein